MKRTGALIAVLALVAACGGPASPPSLPDFDTMRCAPSAPVAATSSSLPALSELAARERAPLDGPVVHAGHGGTGPEPRIVMSDTGNRALARELRAASGVACRLATPEAAERAGYVLSSALTQGVGTHWTNWRLVDQPFNVTEPSMLLYAPRRGALRLIGFSYWVRTSAPDGPSGYTGTADHWHRHFGLCFDRRGMLGREDVANAQQCAGAWLNGADMWMLHAWIVPGDANPWGVFAPLNPSLCSRTGPDIARCPGFS